MPRAAPEPLRADKRPTRLPRRSLLQAGVAAGGGLMLGFRLGGPGASPAQAAAAAFVPNAFIRIAPNGTIAMVSPAVEMGQGTRTSIAMLLAEELDVGLDRVTVEDAPPDESRYSNALLGRQATGGTTTIRFWYLPLRKAGAAARAMLVEAAAKNWGVDPVTCRTADGQVFHDPSSRSLDYGALAGAGAGLPPPAEPVLKDPKAFRLIGQPVKRLDSPDKVRGRTTFGIDVMLPAMRFATLAASPVFGGKVVRVDDSRALALPGVRQVVVLDDMVAVVGDHYWAAKKGLDALSITWTPGANANVQQADIWSGLESASKAPATVVRQLGDAPAQLREGELFEAVYELPLLAHAAMEPMNCTIHATEGRCEVWVGTQVPVMCQVGAALALNLKPEQVTINNHLIGGGFGRRLEPDGVIKAARIARHVDGPLKIVWSREEDIQQALYRPVYHDRLRARVKDGKLFAWHHRVTGSSIITRWLPAAVKHGIDPDEIDGLGPSYDIPHLLTECVIAEPPAVPTCFWRGVGPNSNVFSRECFTDLVAHGIQADPVAFRRSMLGNVPRALAVLDLAAEKAGWGKRADVPKGYRAGRGVALLCNWESYLAAVVDVAVADDGEVAVTRVVMAVDVGTIVNPDTVEAQVQGGAIFGIGAILHGEVTIKDGRVEQSNFHDYRVPRIDEVPFVEVHIVRSSEKPGGVGEPGTVVVQPAIANAVFAATGVQLTRMPLDRRLIARGRS